MVYKIFTLMVYKALRDQVLCFLPLSPSLVHSSHSALRAVLKQGGPVPVSEPLHLHSLCLECSSPKYPHDLLPHFLPTSAQMSPHRGHPDHSNKAFAVILCAFVVLSFPSQHLLLSKIALCTSIYLPPSLKCKFHEGGGLALFLVLYIEQCLAPSRYSVDIC